MGIYNFFPGQGANSAVNPTQDQLPLAKWSTVTISVTNAVITVSAKSTTSNALLIPPTVIGISSTRTALTDVLVYASNPWNSPAPALMRNLYVCNSTVTCGCPVNMYLSPNNTQSSRMAASSLICQNANPCPPNMTYVSTACFCNAGYAQALYDPPFVSSSCVACAPGTYITCIYVCK
jgi:hypothetical protein